MDHPPEPAYTQAQVYAPMEAAAAAAVAALPDFPGFERRIWGEMECMHQGVPVRGYTNVEIEYRFSLPDSQTPLVRETYVGSLRDHWSSLGYVLTADRPARLPDRDDYSLCAVRPDGIGLWYWVAGYVVLRIQSGPVTVSDHAQIPYLPPAGGIKPGGRRDRVGQYFPDGIPAGQPAVNPFESPGSYEDAL